MLFAKAMTTGTIITVGGGGTGILQLNIAASAVGTPIIYISTLALALLTQALINEPFR